VRHWLLSVVALALAVTVCFTAVASATGPGGWSHLGVGKPGTSSLNGAVYALNSSAPGVLFVGGAFTSAGGDAKAAYIARWNGTKWGPVGSPTLNGAVHAIAYNAGKVYAGGVFTNAGGNDNADFLAVWDGTSWKPFCNSVNGGAPITANVMALQIIGNTLYIGGAFQNGAGLKTADYVVACDLTTGNASSLVTRDGDVAGAVYALTADSNGTLYAAGQFIDMAGNRASDHIAAFAGGQWHQMGSGPSNGGGSLDDYARALTAHGTDVYVGTDSLNIGGIAQADHVARWNGTAWSAMGADAAGTNGWFPASTFINAMTTSGSRVFVAGSFQNANGDPRADNIAVFDGSAWHALGSNGAGNGPWNGNGLALATFGPLLEAGGSFTSAGGDTFAEYAASYPLVPDTTAPRVTAYTVAPAAFPPAKSATVRYRLSEAARVLFTVQKAGRKVRSFTRSSPAGATQFLLAGRGLKAGSYSLAEVAVDAAGNRSARLSRPFRVTK
jgi:hypothetical protein